MNMKEDIVLEKMYSYKGYTLMKIQIFDHLLQSLYSGREYLINIWVLVLFQNYWRSQYD